jgi:hypothetical protein
MDDVGRQIRENNKGWERQQKEKWDKEHPRLANAKNGWGKAVGKEATALGRTFGSEGHKLVNDIDRGLKKLFGL